MTTARFMRDSPADEVPRSADNIEEVDTRAQYLERAAKLVDCPTSFASAKWVIARARK